ncbi:aminotransferase class V-fold PLP-dependent enzyme [Nocardioides sp. B-3]|uniref:aminotransferase class V-fold PLP-dependent enzyme n=1 Tax=Nocardioides sp. B-3 TaxID=2895565 RepID=UPI002152B037|nr:aminotransferase class V-fold PLP-dependent enzyme [Nocardioides sp. B-3]UUZ60872.1 aminotransferase class V-fold PLP-dependent enzyme [Nocardioides sp. B-3]
MSLAPEEFAPTGVFLNSATLGLAPLRSVTAMRHYEDSRFAGTVDAVAVDAYVESGRASFATLLGREPRDVAIGSQASQFVGLVAASLPPRSVVLAAEEDFTSVLFPFLRADLDVRLVPLDRLLDSISAEVDLVAVSAVQSADGRLLDLEAPASLAGEAGALTLVDVTRAAGWLPLTELRADYVVGGGYKWLLGPRGTCFFAVSPSAPALPELAAGWYAGESRWDSIYGPPLRLASDARRYDVSPAWGCWVGHAPALELLLEIGVDRIHAHDLGLANAFRDGLGLPAGDSAIVSVNAPSDVASRLAEAGIAAATRAGRLRLSFHLYNSDADVEAALRALK